MYDPDEILKKMRADKESDWPDKLLKALAGARLLTEEKRIYLASKREVPLTRIELNVLQCSSVGLTAQMTADLTYRSIETINRHRQMAIFKLQAKNVTHAVAIALREGLIN